MRAQQGKLDETCLLIGRHGIIGKVDRERAQFSLTMG